MTVRCVLNVYTVWMSNNGAVAVVCFSICTCPCKKWLFMLVFLLITLNTHFIWSFSVSIWFKQLKRPLNIDSNGHQKTKKNKNTENVLKQQKTAKHAQNMFFASLHNSIYGTLLYAIYYRSHAQSNQFGFLAIYFYTKYAQSIKQSVSLFAHINSTKIRVKHKY